MRLPLPGLMALMLAALTLVAGPACADEAITLQLKWKNAFQFAGYYMALDKGFYAQRGLQVTLNEGGPGKNPIDFVTGNSGHYGISDTGVVLARSKGRPIKVLAAVFQHSPLVLAVLKSSGIRAFSDLKGKRVMMQSGGMDACILAAMNKAGVKEGDFIRQDTSFDLNDLIDGHTDAFSVYLTDQPHQMDVRHIPYRLLYPTDYGIDFYGDVLITSDAEVKRHPERVQAFVQASMQGWEYALSHIDETIALIMQHYNTQHLSHDQLEFEAYKTSEMILKDVVGLGYMSPERWNKIIRTYAQLKLIDNAFPAANLLYTPQPGIGEFLDRYGRQLLLGGLLFLLLVFGLQSLLLRRMVKSRTDALAGSERRYRTLVDNLPGAVFRCRPDEQCSMEFISDSIEDISGYPPAGFIDNAERSYRSIIHPDDQQTVREAMQPGRTSTHAHVLEYRIRHADGSERWVLETGQSIGDTDHNVPRQIDGFILDITDRKRAEKLRKSITDILEMVAAENSLQQIMNRIVSIYEARYPGITVSILLLRNRRLHLGSAPNLPDAYNDLIEGIEIGPMVGSCGSAAYTRKRVVAADLSTDPHWADYRQLAEQFQLGACWSEPIINASGEVLGTFAMYAKQPRSPSPEEIDDIAHAARLTALAIERDQIVDNLRKLSRAIEQSSEVITIANRDGIIEYVNPAFTAVTGYAHDEAVGQPMRLLRDAAEDWTVAQLSEAMQNGESWRGKTTERRKDGSLYPAMLTVSPIRNDTGEITHYIAVHEDMSELQRMEEQFYQAQKMEAIGTLVGGIAHDFNNMLAGITGNLYLARESAHNPALLNERLTRIENLSMRAADMIRQLLTFASKDIVQKRPLPLTAFLKETLKLHRVSVPESIDLDLDISDEMTVSADITQMQQLLLNLITNARDALADTKAPRIAISLQRFAPDASFMARHPGAIPQAYARLSVQDNGHGIPDHLLPQIFEPFFTTKEVGRGTGLGLSMVFGTVKSHNGFVDVDSDPDKGSRFDIYLPLSAATDSEPEPHAPVPEHGTGETILLADDETEVRETTAQVLQSLGYEVMVAGDGEEALKMFTASREDIDLILTDVVMPKLGGLDLARAARRIKPDIAIVFATGYDRKQALGEVPDLGHSAVLNKPFGVDILAETLHALILASHSEAS